MRGGQCGVMLRFLLTVLLCRLFLSGASASPALPMPDAPSREGEAVEAIVRVTILDIPIVDEKDRSFQIVGVLHVEWRDPRLKPALYLEQQAVTALGEMWHPDMEFDNEREPRKSENQVLAVKSDGSVSWKERFDARLWARFDLRNLPFDVQTLPIVLQTYPLGDSSVRLTASADSAVAPDVALSEWSVGPLRVDHGSSSRAGSHESHSELVYAVEIVRRPAFYFYAVVVPSLLVVLVAFTTLWYDPRQFNAIVGPCVSCMLVLIALNFTVSSYLPRVSYVTTLHKFSLQCYVFVFATLVANAVAHTLSHRGGEHGPARVRRWSRALLPIAFIVSNMLILS